MLKTAMTMLAAMLVSGAYAAKVQAAETPEAALVAGVRSKDAQETWRVAHVSKWDHYHQCNPSPCPKLKDRHKKGTGSVTE
jgi:hypothetical protein